MLKRLKEYRGIILTIAIFAAVIISSVNGIVAVQEQNSAKQLNLVQQAAYRAAATCYATEGFYPGEIDYLKEHYGLSWDENRYFIRYNAFASNILPEIYVVDKGDE
ncbi:MAG: hypothetical protein Q4C54_01140 [Clostridia bacterium]|nr:hypothetical protein [Clostridia bacterium]